MIPRSPAAWADGQRNRGQPGRIH